MRLNVKKYSSMDQEQKKLFSGLTFCYRWWIGVVVHKSSHGQTVCRVRKVRSEVFQ